MKRPLAVFPAVLLTLAVFLILPFTSQAQTNFVKYRSGEPILPLGSPGAWDNNEAAYAHIFFNGEQYQMWYSGSPQNNSYLIGYATSNDGIHWEKYSNKPVLSTGSGFDNTSVWQPSVLFNGTQYEMWYAGNLNTGRIGYATSPDALTWTRHGGNPVLTEGGSGAWDQNFVFGPVVFRSDTLYHMWYSGTNQSVTGIWQTGYATSTDGINWSKHPNNPVLEAGASGEWDSGGAIPGSVLFEDGLHHMWYFNWSSTISGLDIGYATSPDGINWTKHQGNPILMQKADDWDAVNTNFPRVIKEGHRWRMWYTGRRSGSIDRLCYAEDFSNAAHVDSIWISSKSVVADSGAISLQVYIANPHNESLAARALIKADGDSVLASVDLHEHEDRGYWHADWAIPAGAASYSVGVELNNITAGYIHNSYDWGVFEKFNSHPLTHTFTQIASIDDGEVGEANSLTVGSDGTIFLANGPDGLWAYTFDRASFTSIAYIDEGGSAMGVVAGSDGTVLLANGDDGLQAYRYDGSSFSDLAHIDDGGSAMDVALAADGTIFLANAEDGLRAYNFDGAAFTSTAHVDDGGDDGNAIRVSVAPDGTVFLANDEDGVRAYSYSGNGFSNIWQSHERFGRDIAFGAGGTVFLTSGNTLFSYEYEGASFTSIAQTAQFGSEYYWAPSIIDVAADGTILVTSGGSPIASGGLAAFKYDGASFIQTAHLSGYFHRDIFAVTDDTILVANGRHGLLAYAYSPNLSTSVSDAHLKLPTEYALLQNYPNPFNPSTTIEFSLPQSSLVRLKIYNLLGAEVAMLVEEQRAAGRHTISFDASGLPSGIYYYTLTVGDFKHSRKMLLMK